MKTKTFRKMLALAAITVFGASAAQAADFDVISPSSVANVVVKEVTENSVELTWDKATDNTAVTEYKVYYGQSSVQADGGYYDTEKLTKSDDTEYVLEDLAADTKYYIAVTALDANGNESYNYSIEVVATTDESEEEEEILHSAPTEEEESHETEKEAGKVEAELSVDVESGSAPLKVQFDASASTQKDGAIASYAWDYNSDGVVDSNLPNPSYTFTESGIYDVNLVITGTDGKTDTAETTITVWDTEVVEYTDEPEEVAPEIVEIAEEETTTPEEVEEAPITEEQLPETGPALLIPALIAGAGALITRRRK